MAELKFVVVYFKSGATGSRQKRVVSDHVEELNRDALGNSSWAPSGFRNGELGAMLEAMHEACVAGGPVEDGKWITYGEPKP